jgi:hypothetical protein
VAQLIGVALGADDQRGQTFHISDLQESLVDVFALDLESLIGGASLPDGVGPQSHSQ